MSITPNEYADQLRKALNDITRFNRPLQLAAYSTAALISQRVFTDGVDKEGKQYQYKSEWYKKERKKRGFETRFIDWTYEADLKSDFENSPKDSDQPPTPIRINVNEYQSKLVRPENIKKYEGLRVRFGDFLQANKQEEKLFYDTVEKELTLILSP